MINRPHQRETGYHANNKISFEWLLLCFMAKNLLTRYRAAPPANNTKHQQS